jgi:hypothetical protein
LVTVNKDILGDRVPDCKSALFRAEGAGSASTQGTRMAAIEPKKEFLVRLSAVGLLLRYAS